MSDIELSPAQRDLLRERLSKYCEETFNLELEQFDAEFCRLYRQRAGAFVLQRRY